MTPELRIGRPELRRARRRYESVCRRAIRRVARTERSSQRVAAGRALFAMICVCAALKVRPRAVRICMSDIGVLPRFPRSTAGPAGRRPGRTVARRFAGELARSPDTAVESPVKHLRPGDPLPIRSASVRTLQGRIVQTVWAGWFGLSLSDRQTAALGAWSGVAWLTRSLLQCAGLSPDAPLGREGRRRLAVVVEPFVRALELRLAWMTGGGVVSSRRAQSGGLSAAGFLRVPRTGKAPGARFGRGALTAALSGLFQRRRSGDIAAVLYPEVIDRETWRCRSVRAELLRDEYLKNIRVRLEGRHFENYMHLQNLAAGAPPRSRVLSDRLLAAAERRYG